MDEGLSVCLSGLAVPWGQLELRLVWEQQQELGWALSPSWQSSGCRHGPQVPGAGLSPPHSPLHLAWGVGSPSLKPPLFSGQFPSSKLRVAHERHPSANSPLPLKAHCGSRGHSQAGGCDPKCWSSDSVPSLRPEQVGKMFAAGTCLGFKARSCSCAMTEFIAGTLWDCFVFCFFFHFISCNSRLSELFP